MDGLQVVFFDIGDTLAVAHLAAGRLVSLDPMPGVVQALADLREAGYRLGIISNTGQETADSMRRTLTEAGLFGFFSGEPALLLYSSVVHMTKDSPEIFRLACGRAGLADAPRRCMFVGDDEQERGFAAAAGLAVAATVRDAVQRLIPPASAGP